MRAQIFAEALGLGFVGSGFARSGFRADFTQIVCTDFTQMLLAGINWLPKAASKKIRVIRVIRVPKNPRSPVFSPKKNAALVCAAFGFPVYNLMKSFNLWSISGSRFLRSTALSFIDSTKVQQAPSLCKDKNCNLLKNKFHQNCTICPDFLSIHSKKQIFKNILCSIVEKTFTKWYKIFSYFF